MLRDDDPFYKLGRLAEKRVALALKELGMLINPTAEYNTVGAPLFHGINESYILPDLDVLFSGERFWIEVKYKRDATFNRKHSRMVCGVPKRLWSNYQEVQKQTGSPVYLFFCIDDVLEVRGAPLDVLHTLISHEWSGDEVDIGGTIFLRKDDLPRLSEIEKHVFSNGHLGVFKQALT